MNQAGPSKQKIGDYVIESLIGSGSYAKVFKAKNTQTQCNVALKIISKEDLQNPEIRTHFYTEISILSKVKHPLIVELFDVIQNENCEALVMEFIEKGDLLHRVNGRTKMGEDEIRRIFAQIVSVMTYLHDEMNIVHCDLKLENILIDRHKNIRLIDFGFASEVTDCTPQLHDIRGSPAYVAPEVIKRYPYNRNVDIWGSGITLFTMFVGSLPFLGDTITEQLEHIVIDEPEIPQWIPPMVKDLLAKLLNKDPLSRILLKDIRTHPWVSPVYYPLPEMVSNFLTYYKKIDRDLIETMQECGIQTGGLMSSLVNKSENETTKMYNMLKRAKAIELIAGKKMPRKSEQLVLRIPNYVKNNRNDSARENNGAIGNAIVPQKHPTVHNPIAAQIGLTAVSTLKRKERSSNMLPHFTFRPT